MKAWRIYQHGSVDQLQQEEIDSPIPGPGLASIRVEAIGLNHLDLWVRRGVEGHHFPLPLIPGSDATGTVEAIGFLEESEKQSLREQRISIGNSVIVDPVRSWDPIMDLMGESSDGVAAEVILVPVKNLIKRPPSMSAETAAALPVSYVTAHSMIFGKAKLQKNETVLIHAGGSGVSIAATQMAKQIGAYVVTTVGSDEKVKKSLALGADHSINYKKRPFRKALKSHLQSVGRRSPDVVIDHVGVTTFSDSLSVLRKNGRLITCGATSGSVVEIDLKLVFFKNLSILGNTMGSRQDLIDVVHLVEQGKITPRIDRKFAFDELREAHSYLESREIFGKVILTK